MKIHVEHFVLKTFEHITCDIGLRHKLVVPLPKTSATSLQTSRQVLLIKGSYLFGNAYEQFPQLRYFAGVSPRN